MNDKRMEQISAEEMASLTKEYPQYYYAALEVIRKAISNYFKPVIGSLTGKTIFDEPLIDLSKKQMAALYELQAKLHPQDYQAIYTVLTDGEDIIRASEGIRTNFEIKEDHELTSFAELYFNLSKATETRLQSPHMVVIAAQSGAATLHPNNLADDELSSQGGYVRIGREVLRNFLSPSPENAESILQKLNALLAQVAIQSKANILLETTARNLDVTLELVNSIQDAGYTAELIAQATPELVSKANIFVKHELQMQAGIKAPYFDIDNHLLEFENVALLVKEHSDIFDRVRVCQ